MTIEEHIRGLARRWMVGVYGFIFVMLALSQVWRSFELPKIRMPVGLPLILGFLLVVTLVMRRLARRIHCPRCGNVFSPYGVKLGEGPFQAHACPACGLDFSLPYAGDEPARYPSQP
jgi:hypothetical protein